MAVLAGRALGWLGNEGELNQAAAFAKSDLATGADPGASAATSPRDLAAARFACHEARRTEILRSWRGNRPNPAPAIVN